MTKQPGVAALAAGMICLGVLGLGNGDFAMVWQPVPAWVPGRELLAYAAGAASLAAGLGIPWRRTAAPASAIALAYFFLWWLLLRVPAAIASPLANLGGLGENTVALSGGLALYAALHQHKGPLAFLGGEGGMRLARIVLGLGLIGCGEAHFYYLKATAHFVPGWIPGHIGWAIATGSGFVAAGAAILAAVCAPLAATLATAMMSAFTVLIWLVGVALAPTDRLHWTALAVSWTLTAAAWVVAESYRRGAWLDSSSQPASGGGSAASSGRGIRALARSKRSSLRP